METDKHIVSAGPLGAPTSPSAPPPPFRHSHSAFPISDLRFPIFCRTAASPALKTEPLKTENSPPPSPSVLRPPLSVLRRKAAFTLIELLVVITIIAILAGITIATVGGVQKSSARKKAETEIEALSRSIENYKLEVGSYPPETPVTALYNELTGNGTLNTRKVYFEPPRGMVTNSRFIDPWGNFYNYEIDTPVNVGLFDIMSTAGQSDTNLYIRN